MRPASRMLSAISFGVLRRSAPSTSAIMRSRNDSPGSCVTSITSRSESSLRAAGDCRAVAARLADDGRGLAGDRRLVDRADTLDDLAVGRDDLAGFDDDDVAASAARRPGPRAPSRSSAFVVVRVARSAFACALPRPSAIASAKFAKRTVSQSQTAIDADEPQLARVATARGPRKKITVVMTLPSSTMNITGFLSCRRGSSFGNESLTAASASSREKMLDAMRAIYCPPSLSSARLSSSTFTPGSPKKPNDRPSVFCSISFCTVASGRCRTAATRRDCSAAYAGEMSGSIPEPDVVTASTGMSWIVRPGLYGPRASGSPRVVAHVLRESRARRAEVRERRAGGVVGRRGRRRPLVEVAAALVNACAASFEPTTLPFARDQAAVRLVRERDLREAGHQRRVAEAEDDRQRRRLRRRKRERRVRISASALRRSDRE